MKFEMRRFSKRFPEFECAVFVIHEPFVKGPAHRGTAAAIILPDGRFWRAVALCSPSDPYVRAIGRAKALGRAYRAMRTAPHEHGRFTMKEVDGKPTIDNVEVVKSYLNIVIGAAKSQLAAMREYAGIHQ